MTVVEFEELLDRLGDDLATWPAGQRDEARLLLAQSAEANALLREARAMRRLLARPPISAPAGLADRIVTRAAMAPVAVQAPEKRRLIDTVVQSIWPTGPAWRIAFLTACFGVGVFGGIFHNITRVDRNEIDFHNFVASVVDVTYFRD